MLNRILIRPGDPTDPTRDILVEGSKDAPLALSPSDDAPAVRVSDELEAHFLWQEAGDFFSIFALKDAGTKPEGDAAQALAQARAMLIVLPASQAKSPAAQKPWQDEYPQAIIMPLPKGENLFQAHQKGVDLRSWLIEALPPLLAREAGGGLVMDLPPEGEAPKRSPVGQLTLPPLDVKGLVDSFIKDINAFMDKKMAPIKAFQKEAEQKAAQKILSVGGDPQDFFAAAKQPGPASMLEGSRIGVAKIEKERAKLKAAGLLHPDLDRQLTEAAAKIDAAGKQGQALMTEGQAKIEAAKKNRPGIKGHEKNRRDPGGRQGQTGRGRGGSGQAQKTDPRRSVGRPRPWSKPGRGQSVRSGFIRSRPPGNRPDRSQLPEDEFRRQQPGPGRSDQGHGQQSRL